MEITSIHAVFLQVVANVVGWEKRPGEYPTLSAMPLESTGWSLPKFHPKKSSNRLRGRTLQRSRPADLSGGKLNEAIEASTYLPRPEVIKTGTDGD